MADTWYTRLIKTVAEAEGLNLTKPLGDFSERDMKILLYGTGKKYQVAGNNKSGRPTSITRPIWL